METYDDNPNGGIYSLAETSDGGFVAAGWTAPWAAQQDDVYVLRVDGTGNQLWSKRFGGRGPDRASKVIETREGDYVISGLTTSIGAGKCDFYLLRVSASGDLMWERAFGAETWEGQYEDGARVLQTRGSGFLLVGSTDSVSLKPQGSRVAVYVVKTDGSGNLLWQRTYGTKGGFDVGFSTLEKSEGGFVLAGTRANLMSGMSGLYLIEISDRGDVVWERSHEAPLAHGDVPLVPLATGSYLLGNRRFNSRGETDAYFLCVDQEGSKLWENGVGDSGYHRVQSIVRAGDSSCVALCRGPDFNGYLVWLEAK